MRSQSCLPRKCEKQRNRDSPFNRHIVWTIVSGISTRKMLIANNKASSETRFPRLERIPLICIIGARQLVLSIRCDTGRIIIHKYKRKADARSGAALIVRSQSDATAASTPSDNEERLCSRTRSRRSAPRLATSRRVRSGSASETTRDIATNLRGGDIYAYTRSNMLRTCVTIQH